MKLRRTAVSALTALTAVSMFALQASANLKTANAPSDYLQTDEMEWIYSLPEEEKQRIENISRIEFVVNIDGNADQYEKERIGGTLPGNFGGLIGVGAVLSGSSVTNSNWHEFRYSSLDTQQASASTAGVKKLYDGSYLFVGDMTGITASVPQSDATIAFKEWDNRSTDYSLRIEELYVYAADGSLAFHVDADGNGDFGGNTESAPAETAVAETAAETTEETTVETTEAETTTTASETTTTKAEAETTPAAEQTIEETQAGGTTAAESALAETTTANTDFGSRDSSLLIVGIIAGVVIIGLVVAIVIVMGKKKR